MADGILLPVRRRRLPRPGGAVRGRRADRGPADAARRPSASRPGALCLGAALTLGLAAGSLGLGPGRHARDGFLDAAYLRTHGGLAGESLFWARASSSRWPARTSCSSSCCWPACCCSPAPRSPAWSRPRARRPPPPASACARTADRASGATAPQPVPRSAAESRSSRPSPRTRSRSCAPPTSRRPPSRRDRYADRRRARRSDEPEPQPEPDAEPRARATSIEDRPGAAGGAHADGQPPLGGHRGRRPSTTACRSRASSSAPTAPRRSTPKGIERDRRAADRGAQPLQRRGARDRHGHRPARDPLRAAPGARHQDVQGRPAQGRPRLRAGRRAGAHPRPDPRQAGGGRRGAQPGAQDGPPRRRVPGRAQGLVAAVGLARQGHRRQGDRHRPRQAAAHPDRRHHRLRQVGLRQRDAVVAPAARRPQRGAPRAGRPQAGRAQPLRGHPAPAHPGGHQPAPGGQRARQPDQGDGGALRR